MAIPCSGLASSSNGFAGEVTTIKLLLDPVGSDDDGFYYIASWPTVVASNLEAERQVLARRGVLDQLTQSCRGELPFSLMYNRPTGGSEIVTVVTPLLTAVGCWAVVASFSADAFPAARRHCHINDLSLPSFLPVPRFRGRTIGTPCVSRSRAARHRPSEHTMTA
jgi:hypothetical protein